MVLPMGNTNPWQAARQVAQAPVMVLLRPLAVLLLALLLALPAEAAAERRVDLRRFPGEIDVMTQNQYLGADLTPILEAPTAQALDEAVLQVLDQAADNSFPRRAERQAAEIVRQRPDLVALQEVARFNCRDLPPEPGACADPAIARAFVDQLEETLSALRARGADYRVAAAVTSFDLETVEAKLPDVGAVRGVPFTLGGRRGLLTIQNRDVILQRADIEAKPVLFEGCQRAGDGCTYQAARTVPLPGIGNGAELELRRGFVGIDAQVRGHRFRLVTTQMEDAGLAGDIQAAQADELLAALGPQSPNGAPLILAGDFGTAASDVSEAITAAGFADAWTVQRGRAGGATCCQRPDLRNAAPALSKRPDLILTRGAVRPGGIRLIGAEPAGRTWPVEGQRLWPSDHAGLVVRLRAEP